MSLFDGYNLRKRKKNSNIQTYEERRKKRLKFGQNSDSDDTLKKSKKKKILDFDSDDTLEVGIPKKKILYFNSDNVQLNSSKEKFIDDEYDLDSSEEEIIDKEYDLDSSEEEIIDKEYDLDSSEEEIIDDEYDLDSSEEEIIDEEYDLDSSEEKFIDDEYEIDSSKEEPLMRCIIEKLKKIVPNSENIPEGVLKEVIKYSVDHAGENYFSTESENERWKVGLNDKEINKLEPILKKIRKKIRNEEPSITKILGSRLSFEDKKDVIQLYDVLRNMEPFTKEYIELKRIINKYLSLSHLHSGTSKETNMKNSDQFEYVLKKLRLEIEEDEPNIEKILKSKMLSEDKKKVLQLFDIYKDNEPNSSYNLDMKNNLQKILMLSREFDNEDIEKLEKEEKKIKEKVGTFNQNLKIKILKLDADEKTKTIIYQMYMELQDLNPDSSEYSSLKQKIVFSVNLPHRKIKIPEKDKSPQSILKYCSKIYSTLDSKLYGMKPVKERIIHIVSNRLCNPQTKSMIALCGSPGTGKTQIAKAIAESMNLPFEKISLGGMEDASVLKGTNDSWVGASPSIVLQCLRRMGVSNGVILFDEIDKLSNTPKGKEIQYALLHMTDYTTNSEFQDVYLNEFTHDLSRVWFMFAMNDDGCLDSALRDRLDIVNVENYSTDDIVKIIQLHLLPKALVDVGLEKNDCQISEGACYSLHSLLSNQIKETGLRPVDKEIHQIVSKINMLKNQLYLEFSLEDSDKSSIKLTYSLPDFKCFPYKITTETITRLWSNNTVHTDYLSMYM